MGFELDQRTNEINTLRPGEGSTAVAFPPPLALEESFSPPGIGRIFSLFSRVMRDGLSTEPCAEMPEIVLSGPVFSEALNCGPYGVER